MRLPVRSRASIFWLVCVSAPVLAVAVVIGYLATATLGLAFFTLAMIGALFRDALVRGPLARVERTIRSPRPRFGRADAGPIPAGARNLPR